MSNTVADPVHHAHPPPAQPVFSHDPSPIVRHTRAQFSELMRLVETIADQDYTRPIPLLSGASIAQHVRHVLEFHLCLMTAENGVVNYDARKRDRTLETEKRAVLAALETLLDRMDAIRSDQPLELWEDHSLDGSGPACMRTSLYRELAYALDHGIHHMALIRIAVEREFPQVGLDPAFGVAPSTIRDRMKRER